MSPESLLAATAGLLSGSGFAGPFHLKPLPGGANNRSFRVVAQDACAFLKVYFQHAEDPRDRLGTEFSFSTFAWSHGLRCLPEPLAADHELGLGLYEFIDGQTLQPHEATEEKVQQALAFYLELNSHRLADGAETLPKASEASFSLSEHLACVGRRIERLSGVKGDTGIDHEAASFISRQLTPAWDRVAESTARRASELGLDREGQIPDREHCLSPSDFGFHNAILTDQGRLRFMDFEYAGWDDPAKMVCDFFCQPKVPVRGEHYERFVNAVVAGLPDPASTRQRIELLRPVYQLKWCCILLNDFLPVGRERRRFAEGEERTENRKSEQLTKARRALASAGH